MQLEAVGRVSVGDLGLEVRGQVDDVDGVKGAFLGADAAPDTQALRDEGDLGGGVYLDAQLAGAHHGTRLFAFLTTFLGRVSTVAAAEAAGEQPGGNIPWVCTTMAKIRWLVFLDSSLCVAGGVVGYLVRVDNGNAATC